MVGCYRSWIFGTKGTSYMGHYESLESIKPLDSKFMFNIKVYSDGSMDLKARIFFYECLKELLHEK